MIKLKNEQKLGTDVMYRPKGLSKISLSHKNLRDIPRKMS
jgi:hypothetical protein